MSGQQEIDNLGIVHEPARGPRSGPHKLPDVDNGCAQRPSEHRPTDKRDPDMRELLTHIV